MALEKVAEVLESYRANCSHNLLVERTAVALGLARRLHLVNGCMRASSYLECDSRNALIEEGEGMLVGARTKGRRQDWEADDRETFLMPDPYN